MTPAGLHATAYVYDAVGNLDQTTDPLGRITKYTYDPANRLTGISYSDGHTHAVSYGYDPDGNRTSMSDASGNSTYTYDPLGRLATETNGAGLEISYGYDLDGNPTGITYPNGQTANDTYNAAGELASAKDWLGNTTSFGYDPDGNPTTIAFPASTGETDTTAYDYDDQSLAITDTKGSTTLASETYTRLHGYQIGSEVDTLQGTGNTTRSFGYDPLGQLTVATGGNYLYDPADDPTTVRGTAAYQYNTASELTQAPANSALGTPAATIAYDNLGNRTTSTPTTGAATNYTYDEADNLTQITRPASGSIPAINQTNTYNGDGLLQSTTNASTTSQLAWDTQTPIPVLLTAGGTSIIYGPGQLPVEQITSAGVVTYCHHDQQGSTRLTTSTTGSITSTSTYDSYGNRTAGTGTQPVLGYDAQYADPTTGLIYLRARWYDPTTAQLLTQDPLQTLTQEPYAYASDDPLDAGDPTGLIFGISLNDVVNAATIVGVATIDVTEEAVTDGAATPLIAEEDAAILGTTNVADTEAAASVDSATTTDEATCATEDAGGETVSVFHGSLDNSSDIQAKGLDASQGTTFVSRDPAAAGDAIGPNRPGYPGADPGIIESQIPKDIFDQHLAPNERPYGGFYPYPLDSTEIPLRTPEQIGIFNRFIVP
jgi:RHS repeat-associated protein